MNKAFADFYANDTRSHPDEAASKVAMAKANESFRLGRFHKNEGRLKLAQANLLCISPEQVELEYQAEEDEIAMPLDPRLSGVMAELGGDWHSMSDPSCLEIEVSRDRELQRMGLLYPSTVEICYPPQARAKYGHGVVLDTREVLLWLAKDLETENPDRASTYREIANNYYPVDEEGEDCDGADEDDDYDDTRQSDLHNNAA